MFGGVKCLLQSFVGLTREAGIERDQRHGLDPRSPADFDSRAYLGGPGWSCADVRPLFRRIQEVDRGESELHGAGGPIHVNADRERGAIHRAFVSAAAELGIPFNGDPNGRERTGGDDRAAGADLLLEPPTTTDAGGCCSATP